MHRRLFTAFLMLLICTPSFAALDGVRKQVAPLVKVKAERGEPVDVLILFDDTVEQEAENASVLNRPKSGREAVGEYNLRMQHRKARLNTLKDKIKSELVGPDLEILRDYSVLPVMYVRVSSSQALNRLIRHGKVLSIDENLRLEHALAQSMPLIGQPTVWNDGSGYGGDGTTIAVLDSGVDYTQTAFGSCLAPGEACKVIYAQDFATSDNSLDDDDGHGTNVAGIVLGVAPSAKIAALDVFDPAGGAYVVDTIAAIDWCVANKANYNITTINMSLCSGSYTYSVSPFDSYGQAIQRAVDANIVVVASSGNDAYINALSLPAAYSNVISVGAVYDDELGSQIFEVCSDYVTGPDKVTCFSNSASFLTMLAPGANITAAGIMMGGTSQASPHVAGAAAVLKAAFPNETVAQTVARLKLGQPVTDVRNGISKPRLDLINAAGFDELENGQILNDLYGPVESWRDFYIDIPINTLELTVQTFSGTGDVDLYVDDCTSEIYGNIDTCTFNEPEAGRYVISLYGYEEYNGVSLQVSYIADQDSDGVLDSSDNCLDIANPGQSDLDGNGVGDACDSDDDNDGQSDDRELSCGADPKDPLSFCSASFPWLMLLLEDE